MVVIYAGNSLLETARSLDATEDKPWFVLEDGKSEESPTSKSGGDK
jgi:hypothetical protein